MKAISKQRIVILFHEYDRHRNPVCYVANDLARIWREDGHEVIYLYGTDKYIPADIILVHVNLSVVPDDYIQFAERYPIVLNGHISDIRKSAFSPNLVLSGHEWNGPVILKSDLNYAGLPEQRQRRTWLERRWTLARRLYDVIARRKRDLAPFTSPDDYMVFSSYRDIPESLRTNQSIVVEKFLPEMENGLYHTHFYQCLGNRWLNMRVSSTNPVVKAHNSVSAEDVEPHDQVSVWRKKFGIDYGKIDYLVIDGEAILLDLNKTIGRTPSYKDEDLLTEERRYLAMGLYDYIQ